VSKLFFNPFPPYINFLTILDTLAISFLIPHHAASSRPISKLYTFFSKVFVCDLRRGGVPGEPNLVVSTVEVG
jgi:hypothetical protein